MSKTGYAIVPVAYDGNSNYSPDIISGDKFSYKKRFMILSNKPIPKNTQVYMEFKITSVTVSNTILRNIPLYIGITKEPSLGYLASDFCLGSIYYCNKYYYPNGSDYLHPTSFQTIERTNLNYNVIETKITDKLGGEVPKKNTVIAIAVDMFTNTISIYTNGNKFYKFTPTNIDMNTTTDDIFFCILSPLDTPMTGLVNFGKVKAKYDIPGFFSMYEEYYKKNPLSYDLKCICQLYNPYIGSNDGLFLAKIEMLNSLAPVDPITKKRSPYLIYGNLSHAYKYTGTDTLVLDVGTESYAMLNYPCPSNQKIYIEVTTKEATLKTNPSSGIFEAVGVPIAVGISRSQTDFDNSFFVELWHQKHTNFTSYYKSNGVLSSKYDYSVKTSVVPSQPDTVGVLYDLANNEISIITDGSIFATVPIRGYDYSQDEKALYYIFIKSCPNAYESAGYTIVNTGDSTLDFDYIPDKKDIMSYYYYWNYLIKDSVAYYINAYINTTPYKMNHNTFFNATITVPDPEYDNMCCKWGPGLNTLWKTFNDVTDTESRNNEKTYTSLQIHTQIANEASTNKR